MSQTTLQRTIDAVWRMESARLIAGLTRHVGDLSLAEDLAQDALVAALAQWPRDGVPENPGAWLMVTARRRGIDAARRRITLERRHERLARDQEILLGLDPPDPVEQVDRIEDDVLALMFMTCHPLLAREVRVTLTLRILGGLTTQEIARAQLLSEGAIAQRIVRAKRTLRSSRVPFEIPDADERPERLSAVLEVIYLIFNEGHAATAGERWTRPELCREAMRLGRILAALMPREGEVHGLLALMELQASRLAARTGDDGQPVLLADQDRSRWDGVLVQRGLRSLARAERRSCPLRPYALQAAIAACHARAPRFDATDWPRIVSLYDALAQLTASPVVELNRAVAVGIAYGPAPALEIVEGILHSPALRGYHLLPAVHGDLLAQLGRHEEARAALLRAAELCRNDRERELLLTRADLGHGSAPIRRGHS
jgi:RNA polymerase sigma factor (sigma-70 family)